MTYNDSHRALIRTLWAENFSCAQIARRFNKAFDLDISRCAVIGLANRMGLPKREGGGTWTQEGNAKRLATMAARGTKPGAGKKSPVLAIPMPSDEPKPLGKPGQHAEGCQWRFGDDPKTWRCCGHELVPDRPYCSHHEARARPPKQSGPAPGRRIVMNLDRQFR